MMLSTPVQRRARSTASLQIINMLRSITLAFYLVTTTRAAVEVGQPMYGKGVNGPGGGCGHKVVTKNDWAFGEYQKHLDSNR